MPHQPWSPQAAVKTLLAAAWTAETRTKATGLEFDAYADTISAVEVPEVKK
jgi:hypothetical protein